MKKKNTWILLGSLVALSVGGLGLLELQAVPTVSVTLSANPTTFSGYCPAKITLHGEINVSAPCTVKYRYNASKGSGQILTLNCLFHGQFQISQTVTTSKSDWVEVEVVEPVKVKSNRVNFSVACLTKPNITNVQCTDYFCGDVDVYGTNLGQSQGTKNVKIDNTLLTAMPGAIMKEWTDTYVNFFVGSLIPWTQTYLIAIADGNTVISNLFPLRILFPVHIQSPIPNWDVHPGTRVTLACVKLPASPGSLKLIFKSHGGTEYPLPFVNWQTPYIYTAIPSVLPDGPYDYILMDGAQQASNPGNAHFDIKN